MACIIAARARLLATTAVMVVIAAQGALAQQTQQLPTITVQPPAQQTQPAGEGQGAVSEEGEPQESAWGPVDGIVPTRSATGTKTDTPIIETPQSISVITADRIEQQGATSLSEALNYTAGVRSSVFGVDTRFDWLSIRGFDAYLPGFFVDGMLARNNNTWAVWKVEPYGAERIEVLKGPPSVLYGQANAGGLVNVVSKRPTAQPLNEIEFRFGNHNRLEGAFDFSGPVTEDGTLLYRLTGLGFDTDTQVDHTDQKRTFIAPALTWRPTANTSLTVLGQYLDEDDIPNIGFLPAEGVLLPNPNGQISRSLFTGEPGYDTFQHTQWAVGYLFEHRFDETWQVRQSLRYRHIDVDYKQAYGVGLDPFDPDQRTLLRNAFTSVEEVDAFTMDNQLQADFVTGPIKHTLLAGLDYQNNLFDQQSGIGAAPSLDMYDPDYGSAVTDPPLYLDTATTLRQTGIYLQEQAKLYDRWVLVLGGRYDWASNDVDDRLFGTQTEQEDEAFTWKAGLLYLAPNGLAPYFSYSESFFPVAGIDPLTLQPFEPETGQQYEAGVKFQPPGKKSLVTFAAFDITRQNYLTYDNTFTAHQTGEIRSRGLEVEAVAELADGLDLIGAFTWLPEFEITESSDPVEVGKRQATVPEHMASLWLHYRLGYGPLMGFGFGGGVRYIGETFGDIANSDLMTVPDFTLFDGVVDYETGGWRFAVNVSNIADERVYTCEDTCYYGAGRTVLASVRRRW